MAQLNEIHHFFICDIRALVQFVMFHFNCASPEQITKHQERTNIVKKTGILNQPISNVIAGLGHTDTVVIADAGLPIPATTKRIDLALTKGLPSFLDTLRVVLSEMHLEKVIIAEEMTTVSPELYQDIQKIMDEIPIELCTHTIFKAMTAEAKAVIRTGEFTPYANIILVSGVIF